jgi:hypothetical protein
MWKKWRNTIYEVSCNGEVRNSKTGRVIKTTNLEGYKLVGLRYNNKPIKPRVHRLVAELFLENYSDDIHVHHINGIRNDNRVENLICISSKENMDARNFISFNLENIEKVIYLSKQGLTPKDIFINLRNNQK